MLGRLFLLFGGLVVIALFAALFAPLFVDWSSFRLSFEEQASRILGKKVSVHGTVDARLLPFPSVTMRDVRVGQDVDGTPLIQVAEFSMDMELAPFLSGEARIFDMRLDKPKARIRLLKDGKLDWMRGSRPVIPARNVVLEDVHITGAEIQFIDEATGRNRTVSKLTAALSASSLAGPWRAEGNGTLDGYEAKFSLSSGDPDAQAGQVPLKLRIWPDVQPVEVQLDGLLGVADAKPIYKGQFNLVFQDQPVANGVAVAEKRVPPPRTKGKFELTNERIRVSEYRIEAGVADNPYVITGEATLDTGDKPQFLLTADGQQVDVEKLAGDMLANGKTARDPHISAQRRLQALIDLAGRIPVPQVPGRATISLPAIVTEGTTLRDIRLDIRPAQTGWQIENAVATLPGRTQVELDGRLTLKGSAGFVGKMVLASNQPSGLSDWLTGKVDPAIRRLKAAGFSADVELTPAVQTFNNLEVAVGGATLKGRVERNSSSDAASVPQLSVDLAGNEIDLDALRALASLMTGNDAGEDVLDHSLSAHLKADRLMAFGLAAEGFETKFDFGDGRLTVPQLNIASIGGATIAARGDGEGSIFDYKGQGSVSLTAKDPSAFLAMLRDRLPRHPVLERMARNPDRYADTKLTADIVLGDEALVKLSGSSNGTLISSDIKAQHLFDLTQETEFQASARLANGESLVLLDQIGIPTFPFDGDYNGVIDLVLSGRPSAPVQARLNYRTDLTELTAEGPMNLAPDAFGAGNYAVRLKSSDLEPTLLAGGFGVPQFGTGLPVDISSKLALDGKSIRLSDLTGNVAGNSVGGDLVFDRAASIPTIAGKLNLGGVDLAWLAEAVYGPLEDAETGKLSTKPLAAPMFRQADLNLDLSVGSVFVSPGTEPARDVGMRFVNRSGGMTLEELRGTWLGGTISGRLGLSNSDGIGVLQSRLALKDANLAPLMWQRNNHPVASGRFGFELAAEATAKTPAGLVTALSGSGSLRLTDVVLPDLAADPLPALLSAADRIQGDVTENKVRPIVEATLYTGPNRVGAVNLPFTMSSGQLRFQSIAAQTGKAALTGEARFNLPDQTLEGRLTATYALGENAIAGGEASIGLLFAGAWDQPDHELELGGITNYLSLRAFERERRRVETLQASVLEKQRLRREVALYQYLENERKVQREKAEAEARARSEEEARQRAAEAQRQREQEKNGEQRQSPADGADTPTLSIPPIGDQFRPNNGLPGIAPY